MSDAHPLGLPGESYVVPQGDAELAALRTVLEALAPLTHAQQRRIIRWAEDRFVRVPDDDRPF